ncbi:unnamed protein product [Rhizophagus irregularis]|nr:unnamed protein product [Rhizophagus irregularis]
MKVALKSLHNSQDITADFFKEVESSILVQDDTWVVRCFEPKNADNNETEYSESVRIDFTKLYINSKDESN